jgi:hypothetical protein
MRRSSHLKLSSIAALILCISTYPMQTISGLPPHAATVSPQATDAMSDQLDATLARFYDMYFNLGTFEDRIQQAIQATGTKPQQIEIVKTREDEGFPMGIAPSVFPPGSSPQVWGQVMNSDLTVIGTPVKARSLPTENRTFAFTEYEVRVEKVIAADQNRVLPGDTIIVSRGGGELTVDKVLIKAIEPAFSEFLLNQSYILMLHSIPKTTTYQALASGTYAVRDGEVSRTSTLEKGRPPKKGLADFIADVNAAIERKHSAAEERMRSGRN